MAASVPSPLSSPRLPSPPPITEDQLGPKSPVATEEQQKLFSSLDHGASRRIRPGTKAEDMAEGPPLVDLKEIDSAFQLTEHLKALHRYLTHPKGANGTIAVDREIAYKIAQPPDGVEKNLWLYELCRFLTQKSNSIITNLFSDDPPCSANTCPEMRASEWQYLCAVHDPPKACSAIDYCCHTLDWAANTLTSAKHFPSRLAMGTDDRLQFQQMKDMTNIFRRVYRIYAHAWFQHRDVFWKVEGRTGLYTLFKTVCDVYGLIPEDSYTIPSEAEGLEEAPQPAPPMILRREPSGPGAKEAEGTSSLVEGMTDHSLSSAGTTKRHRHSPSVGAMSVATVVEEAEEEEPAPLADQPSHAVAPPEAQKEGAEAASEPTTSDQPTGESAEPADDSETKAAPEKAEEPESMEEKTVDEEKKEEGAADQAKPEDAKDESPATEGTDSTSVGTTDGQTESADIKPSGEVPESTESQEKNADKEEEALEKSSEKEDAAN